MQKIFLTFIDTESGHHGNNYTAKTKTRYPFSLR